MRLKTEEITTITSAIRENDPEARIYLFGSRTDDSAKGGISTFSSCPLA